MNSKIFSYEKKDDFSSKVLKRGKFFDIVIVKFQSALPTGIPVCDRVWGLYYRAKNSKRCVIALHGLSMVFTTKYFCRKLAKKGISSFILIMPYAPARIPKKNPFKKVPENFDWVGIFKRGLIQCVIDVRKTIDFLEKENSVIGILGISMGANVASIVQSIDERIRSGVYIVGGGNLASMLWESRDFIARMYKKLLKKYVTKKQLIEIWRDIDPLTYAKKGLNVLMINSKYDTSVRPVYTMQLWNALGRPRIIWIKSHHFFLFHAFFIKNLILSYFRKTLQD
jgi:hypothetical protein